MPQHARGFDLRGGRRGDLGVAMAEVNAEQIRIAPTVDIIIRAPSALAAITGCGE
jgi:hypothetical protein